MAQYPLEAAEPEAFTPPSLVGQPDAPVIYLRWGTPREKELQRRLMDEEGAAFHSEESMRAEMINGMRALFTPEEFGSWEAEVRSWWDARDSYEKEIADITEGEAPPFEFENENLVIETLENVARDWRPFRRMQADNNAYNRILGHAINTAVIVDAKGLDAPIKKAGRYIDFDSAREIADSLDRWARDRKIVTTLRPAQELGMECMMRLFLGKERSGNSASPAQSEPTPATSTTGAGGTSGKSKASGRSRKTPAAA